MLKNLLLIIILFLVSYNTYSQVSQQNEYNVPAITDLISFPSSPEASAFTKFGNVPVSLYTGTPNISIPLYTIKGRELELPISLSYDASGIKVDQIATWVGLGWNLHVGGVVTRQANGLPDDYFSATPQYTPFYKSDQFEYFKNLPVTASTAQIPGDIRNYFNYMDGYLKGRIDTQPDVFSFNVNGLSGTIYIDYVTSKGICVEHPDLLIEPVFLESHTKQITGWKIIDAQGNQYLFNHAERTQAFDMDAMETNRYYNSSWYLSQIISKNKKDNIQFFYSQPKLWENFQEAGKADIRRDLKANSSCGFDLMISSNAPLYKIEQFELQSIKVNGETMVDFTPHTLDRKDLIGKKALKSIQVKDREGNQVFQYLFMNDSYFGNLADNKERNKRLKLDGLHVFGKQTSAKPQKYDFVYFEGNLPSRDSFAQDLWGYYNGKNNNTTLIPFSSEFDPENFEFTGANREPSLSFARTSTLKKIVYPTGGFTEFDFKLHREKENRLEHETENYSVGHISLSGAIKEEDPYGYKICDDLTIYPPAGIEGTFYVEKSGFVNITFRVSKLNTNINYNHGMQFAGIYSMGECVETSKGLSCPGFISKDFCKLYNDVLPYKKYGNFSHGTLVTDRIYLEKGYYRGVLLNNDNNTLSTLTAVGTRTVSKLISSRAIGGLLVSKVVDKLSENQPTLTKFYYYDDITLVDPININTAYLQNSNITSGVLHTPDNFSKLYAIGPCNYLNRFSTNQSTQVSPYIAYSKVSEIIFDGSNYNGYTVYDFINNNERNTLGLPYSKQFLNNGQIKEKRLYKSNGEIVEKHENFYSQEQFESSTGFYFYSNKEDSKTVIVRTYQGNMEYFDYIDSNETTLHCKGSDFVVCFKAPSGLNDKMLFSINKYWPKLDSTRVTQYFSGNLIVNKSKYFYENLNHYQVTKVESNNSEGKKVENLYYYPHDLSLTDLILQHRIAEQVGNTVKKDGNTVYRKLTNYQKFGVRVLPVNLQFSFNNAPLETRVLFNNYDSEGNLVEVSRVGDVKTALIWDTKLINLISSVTNASSNQIYYTSFEEDGVDFKSTNGINLAKTGKKVRNSGTFSIPLSFNPPAGTSYKMSYWFYNGTSWVFSGEKNFARNITESGATKLDEVRVYPEHSLMKTYNYDPLIGITSINDENNFIQYYEYDEFNRLKVIKDFESNIMQAFDYHYIER